ncbi:MAG: hypothetical protein CMI16_11265 [Opitutaceae bacterium]|nr:hypothetical protein [Opitutaceae bacterium]|tara:strand:- start:537 stop:938 length:402 start_codon:yes stop_codon:yes gene_type:complete
MVSRLQTIAVLLLLTLWLPATQHCGLEAAGLMPSSMECHDSDQDCDAPKPQTACESDNCELIEDAVYKAKQNRVELAAPMIQSCLCCLTKISPETIIVRMISPARSDVPLEMAPSWQFISRAAPIARAPGYLA